MLGERRDGAKGGLVTPGALQEAFGLLDAVDFPLLGLALSAMATGLALWSRALGEQVTGWSSTWTESHFPWSAGGAPEHAPADRLPSHDGSDQGTSPRTRDFVATHLPSVVVRASLLLKNEGEVRTGPLVVRVAKGDARWHATDAVTVLHSPGELASGRAPASDDDPVVIEVPAGLPPRSAWSVEVRSNGGDTRFMAEVNGVPVCVRTRESVLAKELPRARENGRRFVLLTVAALSSFAWGIVLQRLVEQSGDEWPRAGWSAVFLVVFGVAGVAYATLLHPPPVIGKGYLGWGIPGRWPTRTAIPTRAVVRRPFIVHSKGLPKGELPVARPSMAPTRMNRVSDGQAETDALRWLRSAVGAAEWLGVSPIVDVKDFAPGTGLNSAMADAVAEADVVVFLATDASLQSAFCHVELEEAFRSGRRVVTIVCGDIPPRGDNRFASPRMRAFFDAIRSSSGVGPKGPGTVSEDLDLFYPVKTDEQMFAAMVAVLTIPLQRPSDPPREKTWAGRTGAGTSGPADGRFRGGRPDDEG